MSAARIAASRRFVEGALPSAFPAAEWSSVMASALTASRAHITPDGWRPAASAAARATVYSTTTMPVPWLASLLTVATVGSWPFSVSYESQLSGRLLGTAVFSRVNRKRESSQSTRSRRSSPRRQRQRRSGSCLSPVRPELTASATFRSSQMPEASQLNGRHQGTADFVDVHACQVRLNVCSCCAPTGAPDPLATSKV